MQITTLPKDDVKRGEIYYISRGGYNTGSEQRSRRMNFRHIARFDQQGASALFCVNRSTQSLWNALGNTSECVQRRRCRTST